MQKTLRNIHFAGFFALILALLSIFSPLPTSSHAQSIQATHSAQRGRAWGKEIIVSLSEQYLVAYQNGQEVYSTDVTTGRPGLETPKGVYQVFAKMSPTIFHSPFPRKSKNWYPPTHVQYALEWRAGGYFLHDSWWHSVYGRGTTGWHYDPMDGWQQGSHGCISMPLEAAAWLYHWAPIGTTVIVKA